MSVFDGAYLIIMFLSLFFQKQFAFISIKGVRMWVGVLHINLDNLYLIYKERLFQMKKISASNELDTFWNSGKKIIVLGLSWNHFV